MPVLPKHKSSASRFWAREEISSLTSQEQLAYLKILTTSSVYDLHGLTVLESTKAYIKKRIPAHKVPLDPVRSLAKKGLIVFDEFSSLVFIPGSTSDSEAYIDNYTDFRKTQAVLKRLPANSRPVQLWTLSWFLTNMTAAKIGIVEDFLEYAQIWIKLLINDADRNRPLEENDVDLSNLVLLDAIDHTVSLGDVMSLIVSEQKCFPAVSDTLKNDVLGDDFVKRLNLYIKRRDTYHDSLVYGLLEQFYSLYLEKKSIPYSKYESKTYDPRRIAWMVREYGKELVRERMRLYFDSNDYVHSIMDFKTNFQKLGNPTTSDLSKYWEIIGEHEKRARGNC